ncbi:AraC family transcriptional regulator [Flavitalea sp. BT771]|uniref:AraC family transcriptional regulator n=1 Tax=Flavitalea sp. BT771 TaxID=3063329 RepID=UPI0026E211E0|nr:AraC family transcriptional regulator [Flavitalea sp. BT771]MDO6433686.1 AraC family transcriptional regulator [Flavitalea sp. BT771]MDV6222409.1 AraC family transcriptional regulator [Flavitalea sp. BT771]
MKIQKEIVLPDPGQSFKLFSPSLRNQFYWHYHPEFELVFVEATSGIRHVGQHISSYMESDLVFIGPNIPHLNFDYGVKTAYKQIVVQLKQNFLGDALKETPEFESLGQLFQLASFGLSFAGNTKTIVAERLRRMKTLDRFEQLLSLLEVFQLLAASREMTVLNQQDTSVRLFLDDKIRMGAVYKYIHTHYNAHPDVNTVAASVHLSTPAFCRYFRRQTKMTFTDFVNQYRIAQAKTLLLQDSSISEVCYEVGFESLSYFNKLFNRLTGENPSTFKKRYFPPAHALT